MITSNESSNWIEIMTKPTHNAYTFSPSIYCQRTQTQEHTVLKLIISVNAEPLFELLAELFDYMDVFNQLIFHIYFSSNTIQIAPQ